MKTHAESNGDFRLDGAVAVVTGAGSGIGHAIAELFAMQGARVHVLDCNQEQAEHAACAIRDHGGNAIADVCDVSNRPQVQAVIGCITQKEKIGILVNNAGIAHVGKLENTTEQDFDRIFQVNVKGIYNCMAVCIGHMKANGGGIILNMASIASSAGIPDRFAYSMSKGAVLAMTYSVAKDYINDNIRCNCISPARVYTPFVDGFVRKNYPGREQEMLQKLSQSQPIGRMAEPKEVASLALFLCSKEAAFITGVDYPIDGGFFNIR
jgi:NAD(P)-dependent dehydrogenase (short-subunit alcohol dehydrogenase family)